jgi:hypothetical protein
MQMRRYSGGGPAPSRNISIVLTPINDEQCSVRSIYSMIQIIKIIYFLYVIETIKNEVAKREVEVLSGQVLQTFCSIFIIRTQMVEFQVCQMQMRRYSEGDPAPSRNISIVWTPLNDEQCSVRSIYSMIRIIKIISILREIETVKNGVGKREVEVLSG